MTMETLNWEDIYETLLANNIDQFKALIDTWRRKIVGVETNNVSVLVAEYCSRQHIFVSERFSRTRLNRNRFLGHIYSLFHLYFDSKYHNYLDYYIVIIKAFPNSVKKMFIEIDLSYVFNFIANPYFSIVDLNDYFYLMEDFMIGKQLHNKLFEQFLAKQKNTGAMIEKIIMRLIEEIGLEIGSIGVIKYVDSPYVDYFGMLSNNKALVLMLKKAIHDEQKIIIDGIREEIEYRFVNCINFYCEEALHCDVMADLEEELGSSMEDELEISEEEKDLYNKILFRKLKTYISIEDKLSLGVERALIGRLGLQMPFKKLEEILRPIIVYIRDKNVLKEIVSEIYEDPRLWEIVEMVYDKLTADL